MGARAVFLVGFMGSGKTTVGQALARRLGWSFVDLDETIRRREGQSIPDIFRDHGEAAFRQAETSALAALLNDLGRDSIVALGGGAFAQEQNRALLAGRPTVFLHAPVEELWQRCSADKEIRPLRQDRAQFARLHAERTPHYEKARLRVVTSGKEPPAIAAEIETLLRGDIHTGGSR